MHRLPNGCWFFFVFVCLCAWTENRMPRDWPQRTNCVDGRAIARIGEREDRHGSVIKHLESSYSRDIGH